MKSILLFIISLLIYLTTFAQTSLEEYNFLTKGLKHQFEMGLDAQKEGYLVEKIPFTFREDQTFISFYILNHHEKGNVATLAIFGNKGTSQAKHICIPHHYASQQIQKQYQSDVITLLNASQREYFFMAISKLSSYALADYKTKDQAKKEAKDQLMNPFKSPNDPVIRMVGDPAGSPNQGDTGMGDPGTKNTKGIYGRKIISKPTIKDQYDQQGRIRIKICVDPAGRVIDARYTQAGSTSQSRELIELSIQAAKKYQFTVNENAPSKQCGHLDFNFTIK